MNGAGSCVSVKRWRRRPTAIAAAARSTARLDAELLLAEATGWDRARLAAEPEAALRGERPHGRSRRWSAAGCGASRSPTSSAARASAGSSCVVDRRVLIPRPETELLVEVALELDPRRVLDVGTGSGAIALAIADELPRARVDATDTSAAAIQVARANIERLGLGERVRCGEGSLPRDDGADGAAHYDLVVANLPYVSEAEWEKPRARDPRVRAARGAGRRADRAGGDPGAARRAGASCRSPPARSPSRSGRARPPR